LVTEFPEKRDRICNVRCDAAAAAAGGGGGGGGGDGRVAPGE